ncbi:MAG TPA: glycosyltransferase family 2 protein [Thermoleophilaceae bacterium]|nr:glycosyltransferase family 2 protein [Thermoleophilaceae bacterium]
MRTSFVIVAYNSADAFRATIPALAAQLEAGDELVVVDNASADDSAEVAAQLVPGALIVRNSANTGFAAGCNIGAAAASGELLVLLNPDARPAAGFRRAIERPARERLGWGAWMGLVTMDAGTLVNSSGGVLHFTGLGWAGEAGTPVGDATSPHEIGFVSGACFAIPRSAYLEAGGFPEHFFMYCEDVDLSLRVRLRGGSLGIVPDARVDHDYDFAKGGLKWRRLERNRLATVARTYPAALLALVAPALVVTEVAILAAAVRGGWGRQKLFAWGDLLAAMPRLWHERKQVQRSRAISATEFARTLTPELSSPYLGPMAQSRPVVVGLRAYWAAVRALLRLGS